MASLGVKVLGKFEWRVYLSRKFSKYEAFGWSLILCWETRNCPHEMLKVAILFKAIQYPCHAVLGNCYEGMCRPVSRALFVLVRCMV